MRLQESGEMYLGTILILSRTSDKVRAIDIGEYMKFSKPSVSNALGLLKTGGYITVEKDGAVLLTAEGRGIAEKTYERHTLLTEVFCSLGVPSEVAAADACKIEHDISDETFDAIKNHFDGKKKFSA